jgi:hypothetical protein
MVNNQLLIVIKRATGLEPVITAWKADVLPLHHTRKGYVVLKNSSVGAAGFEPTTSWTQTKRATELRYAPIRRRVV